MAVPPVRFHVDNKAVVDGFNKGEKWCTSSASNGADLWRKIWAIVREMEGQEVEVVKVKAHTDWWDVIFGRISHKNHIGNDLADKAAKAAQKASERQSPTTAFSVQITKAMQWLKWAMKYTVEWADDVEASERKEDEEEERRRRARLGRVRRNDQEESLGHEAWSWRGGVLCRRCERKWSAGQLKEDGLPGGTCRGSVAERAAAQVTGNVNYVWAAFGHSKAALCEKGAKLASSAHPPRWMVDEGRLHEVADTHEQYLALRRAAGLPPAETER